MIGGVCWGGGDVGYGCGIYSDICGGVGGGCDGLSILG